MSNPTNETLANMIKNLKETVEDGIKRTDEHFEKLNGSVDKNSKHRIAQSVHNKWMYRILISLIIPTSFLIIKLFI